MTTFRLSPLTIFLILLGVILVGFLIHHTWEAFTHKEEAFTVDYTASGNFSSDLYGKYSTDNSKTAKLTTNLYYDPVEKVAIDLCGTILTMKLKDGTDLSYNTTNKPNTVTDMGVGSINFTDSSYSLVPSGTTFSKVSDATAYFQTMVDTKVIFMDISYGSGALSKLANATDLISTSDVRFFYKATSPPLIASSNAAYPTLITNTESYRHYKRIISEQGMPVSLATTKTNPAAFGWCTPHNLGVVSIPITLAGAATAVNFVHVMDISNNKHIAAFYFAGGDMDKYIFSDTSIVGAGKSIPADTKGKTGTTAVFTTDLSDATFPLHTSGSDLYVDVSLNIGLGLIYIGGKVGNNGYRAYVKIDTNNIPVIVKSETYTNYIEEDPTTTTTTSSAANSDDDAFNEVTKAIDLITKMQAMFGSKYSNYLLKTEVVPPVCPTCPSCNAGSGVCTNCGGNGGGGTGSSSEGPLSKFLENSGSGASNLLKDSASGAGNFVKDSASGAGNFVKDSASGAGNFVKDSASGAGNFVKDSASGAGNFARDSASGAGNFARDSASGAGNFVKDSASGAFDATKQIASGGYGVTKDVVGGTVGIGREIVGGVGGFLHRAEENGYNNNYGNGNNNNNHNNNNNNNNTGYQNSYGGPQYNQGGYLNPSQQQAKTLGQDPYSYYGTLPPRDGGKNFLPITANFSAFGK